MSNTAQVPYDGLKMSYHFVIHTPLKIRTMKLWQKSLQSNKKWNSIDWYDPACYAIKILDAKYEQVQIDDVVSQL
jgi:hypothetical protein